MTKFLTISVNVIAAFTAALLLNDSAFGQTSVSDVRMVESCADVHSVLKESFRVQRKKVSTSGIADYYRVELYESDVVHIYGSDIKLFVHCWEKAVQSGNTTIWNPAIYRYFDGTRDVATELLDLFERLAGEIEGYERYEVLGAVLFNLELLRTPDLDRSQAVFAHEIQDRLLEQWKKCWYIAKESCEDYSAVLNTWILGYNVRTADDSLRDRAEVQLRTMLLNAASTQERELAVLASFDKNLWDGTARLATVALEVGNVPVRKMVIRLSDSARLDEDGNSYDSGLRDLLEKAAKNDSDIEVRKEAKRVLSLPPFPGVG